MGEVYHQLPSDVNQWYKVTNLHSMETVSHGGVMRKRTVLTTLVFCVTVSLAADQKPAEIYFGSKRFFAGMSKSQAAALLSECCILHPALDSEPENMTSNAHGMVGHFVDSKQDQLLHSGLSFSSAQKSRASRDRWMMNSTLRVMM